MCKYLPWGGPFRSCYLTLNLKNVQTWSCRSREKGKKNLCLEWAGILEDFWEEVAFELHLEGRK